MKRVERFTPLYRRRNCALLVVRTARHDDSVPLRSFRSELRQGLLHRGRGSGLYIDTTLPVELGQHGIGLGQDLRASAQSASSSPERPQRAISSLSTSR